MTAFSRRHDSAFTLIELLIAFAMISIALAIGIPSAHHLSGSSRVSATANDLVHHLHYARSEAIRLVTSVVICPSRDGSGCDDVNEWHRGFMLFADSNQNRVRDQGELLLKFKRPEHKGVRVWSSVRRKKLIYRATGMAPGSTATITVCDRHGYAAPAAVIISNPGRPRLSRTRADGSALQC